MSEQYFENFHLVLPLLKKQRSKVLGTSVV